MERYLEKIAKCMRGYRVQIDDETYAAVEGLRAIYARVEGEGRIIVDGACAFQFDGHLFGGEFGVKVCLMNHENRLAMNRHFKYTVPQAVGTGFSTCGTEGFQEFDCIMKKKFENSHEEVVAVITVKAGIEKQSLIKMIDDCAWQAFLSRRMERFGFCVDSLVSTEEVLQAVDSGASMIILEIGWGKKHDGIRLIKQAISVIRESGRLIDLGIRISKDDSDSITVTEHFALSNELKHQGLHVTGVIPGSWKGDLDSIMQHGMIARAFGYKLGIDAQTGDITGGIQEAENAGILYHISLRDHNMTYSRNVIK